MFKQIHNYFWKNNIQDSNNKLEIDNLEYFIPETCDDYFSPFSDEECEILLDLYEYDNYIKISKKDLIKENHTKSPKSEK